MCTTFQAGQSYRAEPACIGIRKVGDSSVSMIRSLKNAWKWGMALAGKARGEDAELVSIRKLGQILDPKSISHEHTIKKIPRLRISWNPRLCGFPNGRPPIAGSGLHARTIQIKRVTRFHHFTRVIRFRTYATDTENIRTGTWHCSEEWRQGAHVRLLGVHASCSMEKPSKGLLKAIDASAGNRRCQRQIGFATKFGESSVSLAAGMRRLPERTHENPVGLCGQRTSAEIIHHSLVLYCQFYA